MKPIHKHWSDHEERVLLAMSRDKASQAEIAATLGRTVSAVESKAASMQSRINKEPDPVAPVYAPRPGLTRAELLTSAFCGDPQFGRSALDQRVMG